MNRKTYCLLFCLLASLTLFAQTKESGKQPITLENLLTPFYDLSTLPHYETGIYAAQESSYDRTGKNDDGFGGTYSFVRKNPDGTLVLFEQEGPGYINRLWTPTPTDDTLDFYLDDTLKPAFSIMYRDLYTGKIYPFVAPLCSNQLGGYYCYLPIPYNKYCKIVMRAQKTMFHQIGYKRFPAHQPVQTFSLNLNSNVRTALERISKLWNNPAVTASDLHPSQTPVTVTRNVVNIQPGQTLTIYQSTSPGRITGFELITGSAIDTIARAIDLKITWDGEQTPAVYCPLADYFGYAFGKASMQGLLAGSDGKRHYSWFPMPYDRSAKVELVYRKTSYTPASALQITTRFYTQNLKRDAKHEGKFYANWRRQNPVPQGKPFTMLDVNGRGHLAGSVLQAQGLNTGITVFFEGDDSTVIDGELRMHGTGSEDYFNGGWYALLDRWDDAMSLPLSGSLDYSIPLCRTGGYRFFLTDKIPFEKSIFHSIEHGPEYNLVPSDYTSVTYYYCDRNGGQPEAPNNHNTTIYMPDTLEIYPQLMNVAIDNKVSVDARWTGMPAKTLYCTIDNHSLVRYSLQDIPPGTYDIHLHYRKTPDAASFSLWQRQTPLTDWIDAQATQEVEVPMEKMASITLTELNNTLSFRFRTTEKQNKFVLTRMILVRKK